MNDTIKKSPSTSSNKKSPKKPTKKSIVALEPIYFDVAGIDIGAHLIHVAVLKSNGEYEIREFQSTTPDLIEIVDWLKEYNVKIAAMEATGVYWQPLFEILEERGLQPVLVDPKSCRNVPGKKTDVLDCQWIHRLYSCGLLSKAFIPPKKKKFFRSVMRHRSNLVRGKQKAILQMNKQLLLMNIKLESAVSEIASITGMNIIRAIVNGERDPKKLALLRYHSCKKPENFFIKALTGNFQPEHLFALEQNLGTYDFISKQMDECDDLIYKDLLTWEDIAIEPMPANVKSNKNLDYALTTKPDQNQFNFDIERLLYQKTGVDLSAINSLGPLTIATIISELGGKEGLESFKNNKYWCSWLTLCPGNNVSGGKRLGGQSRKSKSRIKRALMTAAMSLCNSRCHLGAYYRRLACRISKSKALKAVAHKVARIIYDLLKHGTAYVAIGQEQYLKKHEDRKLKNLQKNAQELGFKLVAVK
jgi:transposase